MTVPSLNVTASEAQSALLTYKAHRGVYDRHDWEIERIYRQIAKGKKVISAFGAIRAAGVDQLGRPHLALMRADQDFVRCEFWMNANVIFNNSGTSRSREWYFDIAWPARSVVPTYSTGGRLSARLPRIPPQHRPAKNLSDYHLLWEADWTELPRDPLLLKRLSYDAWIVLATWDLTDVELSVLRARA